MNRKEILMYRGIILFLCLALCVLICKLSTSSDSVESASSENTDQGDFTCSIVSSTESIIQLPSHSNFQNVSLENALNSRRTVRSYTTQDLNDQQIADLLWAAVGVNREDGKRTSPTACNSQEMDVYLFTPKAVFYYEAASHSLKLVKEGDFRSTAGNQPFFGEASIALAMVADFDKMVKLDEEGKQFYSATDAGFACQNVYLYCAASGLSTVVCGNINREAIVELLGLKNSKSILSMPVGYEK